jgi:glycosyltransferase involved in cell wall biosynthesis
MLRLLDIRDEHISMLRPGVDGRFAPRGESKIPEPPYELLYVGALTEHKGYPLFLRALSQLDADIHARVVGGGDPNRDLIQSLGLTDRVTLEGFVKRADLPELYTDSDLFVLPSIDEMGANTQIEALASGTPVIATDTIGLNYLYEDSAIRYFDPRTPNALQQTITSALNDIRYLTYLANKQSHKYNIINTINGIKNTYAEV